MTRTALYARLSQDRNGESTSIDRQLADSRAFASARGWEVVEEYTDRDLSAYSGAERPGLEAMLSAVQDGHVDVVVAWKLDRLLRRSRDWERVWSIAEAAGANVATVQDSIDTSSPMTGKLVPRLMTMVGELESESISIRARSKAAEIARAGRHHGGGTRPFGLSADWSRVRPTEAALIHEAARRVLDGDSLHGIAIEWNQRGVKTSTGGHWRAEALRQMLVSPRIAGLRSHRGAIVGSGGYPAILDEPTFRALEARLQQRRGSRGPQPRAHLLSGILHCSRCGRPMVGHRDENDVVRYMCQPKPRGCGGTLIKAAPMDDMIREAVLDYLDTPALASAIEAHESQSVATVDLEALHTDEQALEQLAIDHYADRRIGRSEFLAARDVLEARVKAAKTKMSRTNGTGRLRSIMGLGSALRQAWDTETFDWRRALILAVVESIVVRPGRHGFNQFDPSRATISWRY
jgi:site-specific DNA recombinase